MKCLLIYFTGTFNTRYVSQLLKKKFENVGCGVDLYEINPLQTEQLDFSGYDLIGLGYPIYGFAAPYAFLKFVRAQHFPKGAKCFIYKNSGETKHANDASSIYVLHKLHRDRVDVRNEYHFVMPYNIHFRFEDELIREMFMMNDKLMDVLVYEVMNNIPNLRRYKLWPRFVTAVVSKPQYIGGDVNSFLYKVDESKCVNCDLCVKRCPTQNIYRDENGKLKFHHHCLMCMRCSFYCPTDAFYIGFLDQWGWKVNGGYDFQKIERLELEHPVITDKTEGFFHCYIETYKKINQRYNELFCKKEEEKKTGEKR